MLLLLGINNLPYNSPLYVHSLFIGAPISIAHVLVQLAYTYSTIVV